MSEPAPKIPSAGAVHEGFSGTPEEEERWKELLERLRAEGRSGVELAKFLDKPSNRKIMAGLAR